MKNSMYDDTSAALSLVPAVRLAAGASNGTSVDMVGQRNYFRTAMAIMIAGDVTDANHLMSLQHSADGTTWVDVPPEEREGAFPTFTSSNKNKSVRVGYKGGNRYLRIVCTVSGSPTAGGATSGVILLGSGSGRPVT